MSTAYPPPAETLPHEPPMVLLDRILYDDGRRTECAVTVHEKSPFVGPDGLPCLVTLEYMAQCIAVGAGLKARALGEPPPPGMLIGSRELTLLRDSIPLGSELRVQAIENLSLGAFGHYTCEVRLGAELVSHGVISVARFDPDSFRDHGA